MHPLLQRRALEKYLRQHGKCPRRGIPIPEGSRMTPNRSLKDFIELVHPDLGAA
jgi:hypothetical protein